MESRGGEEMNGEEVLFFKELDFSADAEREMAGFAPQEEGAPSFGEFWSRYAKKAARPKLRMVRADKLKQAEQVYQNARALARDHFFKMSVALEQKGPLQIVVHMDHPFEVYMGCYPAPCLMKALACADEFSILPVDRYSVDITFGVRLMGEMEMQE